MRILYETADQVDTYRAVWYYTESRPLCQKLHPKQMRRTNQVMTTQPPSSDELNTKALTVLRAARNVFLTHGFSATTDMIQRERSEEHTSELQSLMRISYAVFCLKKKKKRRKEHT